MRVNSGYKKRTGDGQLQTFIIVIAKQMAAVIVITVTVIIAKCSRVTSMIMPANRNAAVIIGNRRLDHEFVIIAPVNNKCSATCCNVM